MPSHQRVILIVLDGWGYREEPDSNAIAAARTPHWDRFWKDYPHQLIDASGASVGLPPGQMGNSEVGHMHLGAGRRVPQDFTRINEAIADRSFFRNETLTTAMARAAGAGRAVHLLGLLSPGGVHSHEQQLLAMAELAAEVGVKEILLHAFLDGRDTPPRSAAASIQLVEDKFAELGVGRIATLIGRYYAMDRNNNWDRIQLAYDLLTKGETQYSAPTALAGLEAAYARDESDEFVQPTLVLDDTGGSQQINAGDVVVFANFRADRARQLSRAFIGPDFQHFARELVFSPADFVTLTEYAEDIPSAVAFSSPQLANSFGEYISGLGLQQLRIAETEKYAHVTFFFNGGAEQVFAGEERILVPSPAVPTYDLQPEMSAVEVTDKLVAAIQSQRFDAIICNFANPDMVGHTGNMPAAIIAVETVDQCLGRIEAAARQSGAEILITADHGNVEKMVDHSGNDTGQPHTAHTSNLVPLVYCGRDATVSNELGSLVDIAPTLLTLMGRAIPAEMTGRPLVFPIS